jgi:hypothetical protein
MLLILVFYLIISWVLGALILQRLVKAIPSVIFIVGSFLIGTLVSVPVTYLLSSLFVRTGNPILWGTIATIVIGFIITGFSLRVKDKTKSSPVHLISDIALILFAFAFSVWLMMKTFHGDASGQLFVGSNNIFDFSHALGMIRSFSFGSNIPFMSPFQAGLPYFYHFLFNFYVALWEYFGVSIVWAMNIPSIVAFTSLLVVIYFLPQLVFKQTSLVGWIAVLLTLTNSTLTWWQILIQKGLSMQTLRSFWVLPTYPFAGPFDGSTISIFMTLNNFVNQRHLAFAIADSLFLVILVVRNIEQKEYTWKKSLVYGVLFGLLGMWNSAITMIAIISVIVLLFLKRLPKLCIVFATVSGGMLLLWYGQYLHLFKDLLVIGNAGISIYASVVWNPIQYFMMNLGALPIIVLLGYFVVNKKSRVYGLPFLLLGITFCILSAVKKVGFDQKFLSFLIIWANVFAAIGVGWLWQKRSFISKVVALCLFVLLTVSGVIDLLPIKNEFAYPIVDSKTLPVISWLQMHTAKDAVFVSYSDMVDPVAFAGRKNYFGFFGNIGKTDRSSDVKNIYAGDIDLANKLEISYILVPKWKKSDFPYVADTAYFLERRMLVYEDERFLIVQVK